ncbi:hypothetical protein DJ66_0357 [Candidatus Liberibacter solanacearum]|uniref:Uncharacterized protein n=1 Tax=Candidatus Liberibacter solanacearum TaxID=556287 RepID=A0A0F4VK76_9HYPH|nr:hypothetical protein DJ66_0357 [Candidatus Liberibacter solanacearum]
MIHIVKNILCNAIARIKKDLLLSIVCGLIYPFDIVNMKNAHLIFLSL